MRINTVTIADIRGKTTDEALEIMFRHCKETDVRMTQISKQVEILESKVNELERQSVPIVKRGTLSNYGTT